MKDHPRAPRSMKLFAMLALALVVTAGCLESPAPAPGPTPSTSPSPSPSPSPGGGGSITPAPHAENESRGFRLVADATASAVRAGGNATFSFVATNVDAAAEALADPCGQGNPRAWVEDANGSRLELRPPQVRCMAMASFVDFAPNATVQANLTWNGTAYRGSDAFVAPPGAYRAVGEFEGRRDGNVATVRVVLPFALVA